MSDFESERAVARLFHKTYLPNKMAISQLRMCLAHQAQEKQTPVLIMSNVYIMICQMTMLDIDSDKIVDELEKIIEQN